MSPTPNPAESEIRDLLNRLGAAPEVQSNCMFQLALMLARIAIEPCAEGYKDETGQALLALIRAKPKSNVIRLFGAVPPTDGPCGTGAARAWGHEGQAPKVAAVAPVSAMTKRS